MSARKSEAQGNTVTVEWRGLELTIPATYDQWSVDFVESLEEGKAVGIVRGAVGPDQWRAVKAMNLNMADLAELSNEIAKGLGFGETGESSASSD